MLFIFIGLLLFGLGLYMFIETYDMYAVLGIILGIIAVILVVIGTNKLDKAKVIESDVEYNNLITAMEENPFDEDTLCDVIDWNADIDKNEYSKNFKDNSLKKIDIKEIQKSFIEENYDIDYQIPEDMVIVNKEYLKKLEESLERANLDLQNIHRELLESLYTLSIEQIDKITTSGNTITLNINDGRVINIEIIEPD